ncbi:Thioredoxin [Microbacterium hydrocarbonoxydans]|uniref:Thioredoxin n=1 Tax=Microbacterium hydrocarbonoxydans TaxID=273678 RepID=A0A0M2HIT3_9MICO|nr:thioredoxin family protein [Microbacterium hydrocarbonoxydans]KJL46650.1 Thioredoxin [Microbacterium hydrocarbonoxydans]
MSPLTALAAAGALLLIAAVIGVVARVLDGRRRGGGHLRFDPADARAELGTRATLVQFSTEMCARCPQVRRMLGSIAAGGEGLAHVEVDLTHRPDLSHRYKVLQTPTTFLVDDAGVVRARFNGVPHRHALAEALAAV